MSPNLFRIYFIYQFHSLYSFVSFLKIYVLVSFKQYWRSIIHFCIQIIPIAKNLVHDVHNGLKTAPESFPNKTLVIFCSCARFCVLFDLNILEGWLIVVISVGGHCSPGQCSALSKFRQFGQYWGNTGHWWRARLVISKLSSSGPGPAGAAQNSKT